MNYKIDPDDSQQNAFVQDWLQAWAKKHTVFGTNNWMVAACKKIADDPDWADMWHVTVETQIKDAEEFQGVIDGIQETYNYEDHQQRRRVSSVARDDEVYILTTFRFDRPGSGMTVIDQEVFDEKSTFELEPNQILRVANINGGDSAPIE
jgi:hypothetical protein